MEKSVRVEARKFRVRVIKLAFGKYCYFDPNLLGIMADKDWRYRAQFWVRLTKGKEAFSAVGVNGQWVYMNKNKDIAITRQSFQPVSSSPFFDGFNLNAFDTIIEHLAKK